MYDKEPGGLPTFNVGVKEIPILDAAVKNQTLVRLNAQVEFIPDAQTSNIVGILPGESKDEIVLFAHLDTVYNSPGANDNTASLLMILMIAHAVSGVRSPKTLTFLATTGEEYNYLGAIHYAKRRKREGTLQNIKLMMNFDSITWGPNMEVGTTNKEIESLIREIDRDLNIPGTPEFQDDDGFTREARPFKDEGVEAEGMIMGSNGYDTNNVWHRPDDTAENVPGDCAEIAFLLFHEFLLRVQGIL
jgi:Zn-dependent M28 family amino/carboxypeptidase